jgi:chromosomal replication initiator protein
LQKDLKAAWQNIIDKAVPNLPEGSADLWLSTCTPTGFEEGELVVDATNVFVKEQLLTRGFLSELNRAAQETGEALAIRLTVKEDDEEDGEKKTALVERLKNLTVKPAPKSNINLNPNYTFSSFVVGKSNRFAHAASLAVADMPGRGYNPLFIWGGVGLGKTHLMHAICHYALKKKEDLNVLYVSSEKFFNDFVQAIKTQKQEDFKNKYRYVADMLLIDDIQFIGDRTTSSAFQEELFHTFNALHEADKQVVICSDRHPTELRNIEERLVSRFAWGLVTDVQTPDFETRIAILQKKAQLRSYDMSDEIFYFLAQRIPSNIRELEGALNRVIACAELTGDPVDIDHISDWLKDILKVNAKAPTTISHIQNLVAESFEMSMEDLLSPKRTAEIVQARQIGMYLCRDCLGIGLQPIARAFNRKDHTTVLHAEKKIRQMIKDDDDIRKIVDNIKSKL